MSASASQNNTRKPEFWIVCCEETNVTQQIAKAVASWQLSGVRSHSGTQLPLAVSAALSEANCAIFITLNSQPCSQIAIRPLSARQVGEPPANEASALPASLLRQIGDRHSKTPQAWWFQLPTTEIRARQVQPIAPEQIVSQALSNIEIFVRNYYLQASYLQSIVSPAAATETRAQVAA